MKLPQRDLLVLLRTDTMTERAIEAQVEQLSAVVSAVENPESFCNANELMKRNHITRKAKQILKAANQMRLQPFYFLINKN